MSDDLRTQLKADGNLSYLDFIRLLSHLWLEAHPEILIVPFGGSTDGRYPCIVYSQDVRTPYKDEPKARQREVVRREFGEPVTIIKGQRFLCIVKFSALARVDEDGAHVAEELIEVFEDFLLYHTPIFKRLGLAEFTYNRRMPDDEQSRTGEGIVTRTLAWNVSIEKLTYFDTQKLERVFIEVVKLLEGNDATPSTSFRGYIHSVWTDNNLGP